MSRALITEDYLEDIADAIRAKNLSSDRYTPAQMAAAIQAIPTSGITPTGTVNITQNGTHDVSQYASANVNVQPNLQSKTVTENGTVTPDQGYDGLSEVVVNVQGGGGDSYFRRLTPLHTDLTGGFITDGVWFYGNQTARTDIYALEAQKNYVIMLGAIVGNRFHVAFFLSDPADVTANLAGTKLEDIDNVPPYVTYRNNNKTVFSPNSNGYLGIGKTNQSVDGLVSYVFEILF